MGDVCAGRTSMFQDLVRLLAIKKKSDQKNPVDRHDIFIIEEGHKMKKMIGYCGLDCENATHISQRSMTIRHCGKKRRSCGLN